MTHAWIRRLSTGFLFFSALLPSATQGISDEAWIGTRVIVRSRESPLTFDGKVFVPGDVHRVYRVESADGLWLWVVADDARGWIRATDVIPFDRAIDHFTAEIGNHPQSAWAYEMRALIWYDRHDYDHAIADDDVAIRLDPSDALAYHNRGNAFLAKLAHGKAIADYNEAIRLNPRDATSYENRSQAWAAKNEDELAIADLNEAIRLDPDGLTKHHRRAQAWANLRQYTLALADYETALQISPADALALNGRAWIWATTPESRLRSGIRAVASATLACKLTDWKAPYDLGTLAAAHAEAGNFDAAAKWQALALELFPKDDPGLDGHRNRLAHYQSRKPWRDDPPTRAREPGGSLIFRQ